MLTSGERASKVLFQKSAVIPVTELFVRMLCSNFNSIHTVIRAVDLHNCVTFSDTFKIGIFLKTVYRIIVQ